MSIVWILRIWFFASLNKFNTEINTVIEHQCRQNGELSQVP